MNINVEYCDPFSQEPHDIWMKLEHCGRYLFAHDFLAGMECQNVVDMACANGYGSEILSEVIPNVTAADKKTDHMVSSYLRDSNVYCISFDFDEDLYPQQLFSKDAIVCYETIEHLKYPFKFLQKITSCIKEDGWLLLSFPNAKYELFNPDGTNKDIYHLHVLDKQKVIEELEKLGFGIVRILGQPVCNEICTLQHALKEKEIIKQLDVDRAFSYDKQSIIVLSRLLAYPQEERLDNTYSFIVVAQKRKRLCVDAANFFH